MISPQDAISLTPPSQWRVVPFWSLFQRRKSIGHADEELLSVYRDHGVIPTSSRDDNHNKPSEDLSGYQLVTEGALVTNKMKAWQGSIAISRYRGIVSPAYYVYQPLSAEHDQFLHYLLRSEPYIALYQRISKGVRVSQWDLEHEALRTIPVLLPDIATQKRTADFLDTETARIDALIEKKQRFSEILTANRMDAVLQVFERFNAPAMQITPETYATGVRADGWSVRRVKHVIRFMTSGSRGWSDLIADEGELFLQSGNIGRSMEIVLDTAQRIRSQTGAEAKRTRLRPKDVLVCITGGRTGAVGYLEQIAEPAYINQHVCLLRARPALMDPKLLAHVLYSRIGQKQLDFFQYGLKQGLGFSQVGEVRVPVPPSDLQNEILREIDQALMKIDRLLDRQSASITRLREYRAALITAAVTGQIDVADHARPMYVPVPPSEAEVITLHRNRQPLTRPDRRTVRVLVAAEVVHRLGAQPSLGRIKLQKLMYLAEAHANINDIDGCYLRYSAGPYDAAMVQEIEAGLRQENYYDAREDATADRGRVNFHRMLRGGAHHAALSARLGSKADSLRSLVDLFKDMNTEATEAVATLYAVWNDARMDGQEPDDADIIRGFLQEWPKDKGKFKQADLQTWLGWMRRNGIVPHGTGPRTISTSTPNLFESE